MAISDASMAARAASMIARWGGNETAQLLRGTTLRPCTAAVLTYNPRAEQLNLREAERAYVAAPLTIPPDHEQDYLIKDGKKYAIITPVKGPRPSGVDLYYDLDIVYKSAYP